MKLEAAEAGAGGEELARPSAALVGADGKRYVRCGACGKAVAAAAWRRHARGHAGERRYSCHACGRAFADGANLARHARAVHAARRPFPCRECGRAFTRREHLRSHERSHAARREFLCDVCGKASASAAALRMHRASHAARRLACPHCAARFKRSSELRAHASVHSGERAHACACGRAFRLRGQLTAHRRTHGPDDAPSTPGTAAPEASRPALRVQSPGCPPRRPADDRNGAPVEYVTTHVEPNESNEKEQRKPTESTESFAKKLSSDIVIPVRMQHRSKPAAPTSDAALAGPTPSPLDPSPSCEYAPVLLLLRAAGTVDLEDQRDTSPPIAPPLGRDSSENEDGNVEPGSVGTPRAEFINPTETEAAGGDDASPRRNEFSDQSDTENEFGRLPESVFDAIEDTEDGHSSDADRDSPGAGRASAEAGETREAAARVMCASCDKAFASKERLAVHRRTHTKERPFPCRVCGKAFGAAAGRYIHERTHSARRPHACGSCGRAFPWRAALARHEARHAARREHACGSCGRGFSVRADLVRHARAHRPASLPCALCGERFKQERYLKVHVRNVHYARGEGAGAAGSGVGAAGAGAAGTGSAGVARRARESAAASPSAPSDT